MNCPLCHSTLEIKRVYRAIEYIEIDDNGEFGELNSDEYLGIESETFVCNGRKNGGILHEFEVEAEDAGVYRVGEQLSPAQEATR